MSISVPEAARKTGRNPETIRRWIREGKVQYEKVGTQYFIPEEALTAMVDGGQLPLPEGWKKTMDGRRMPDVVDWIRRTRSAR